MTMTGERMVTFAEAAALLPTLHGKRVSTTSVWRWARKGLFGVRLEAIRIGARFLTSVEALDRFNLAVGAIPPGGPDADRAEKCHRLSPTKSRRPAARTRAVKRAERRLAAVTA
jgi:hypothetical protein